MLWCPTTTRWIVFKEERNYILNICVHLSDACYEFVLHFLAKLDIMVLTDIERGDIDFISGTLHLPPVAHVDHFSRRNSVR